MATLNTDVLDAFRELGLDEAKARKAAEALNKRDEDLFEIKATLKVHAWMLGANIGLSLLILGKLLVVH